jgi:uncharacterized membrane protein YidH (DUF202 family)
MSASRRARGGAERPSTTFDFGLQHERTALAWERTAISIMVTGVVLARFAAIEALWFFAGVGLVQTALGAVVLVWASAHYEDLHGPLRDGTDVVHPSAARVVGLSAVGAIGLALVLAVVVVFRR